MIVKPIDGVRTVVTPHGLAVEKPSKLNVYPNGVYEDIHGYLFGANTASILIDNLYKMGSPESLDEACKYITFCDFE